MLRHLTRNNDERRRVHVSVGDSGYSVRSAWARGDEHYTDTAGGACITFRHVHRALLVTDKVVRDAIARAPEFVVNVKHRPARIAEYCLDTFMDQSLDQHFRASRYTRRRGSRSVFEGL